MGGTRHLHHVTSSTSLAKTLLMILCDTDILIEFYKNTPQILQEFKCIGHTHLAISAITQAELMETYCLSHKLALPDAIIAATALVHKVALYTLNRRDFQYIPEIQLYYEEEQRSHS